MRTFITRGLLVAVAMTLVGACGDDKKVLKKADYIKKADAICAASDKKAKALGDPKNEQEMVALFPELAAISIKSIEDVEALGEPDSEAAKVKKMLSGYKALFETVAKAKSFDVVKENGTRAGDLSKIATAYGFKECGGA